MANEFDVFSVRELRTRTGDLLRDAEEGRMALITKHGKPVILALPFNDTLLQFGVEKSMALTLYGQGAISMGRAAKLAGMKIPDFIKLLGKANMVAVDYPPEELDEELKH